MNPSHEFSHFPLIQLQETTSTSEYLKTLARERELEEFTTITAEFQTAGKGQRGNNWESERGKNLLFSTLVFPGFIEIRKQFVLSQAISLSVKETLDTYAEGFSVKWPNDIYWENKKICGILAENDLYEDRWAKSVIGIGLNVNQEEFRGNSPNPVSLCRITGGEHDRMNILKEVMSHITRYYRLLKAEGAEQIAGAYHRALYRGSGFYPFGDKDGAFMAEIQEILPGGTLVLKDTDGKRRHYAFKEVRYL